MKRSVVNFTVFTTNHSLKTKTFRIFVTQLER